MATLVDAHEFVGLIPAAGRGARLPSLLYPKELLPIYEKPVQDDDVRPRAIAEYALDAMRIAEVVRCVVVVAPRKLDIVTYLGDGAHLGMEIAYVVQEKPRGLPYAVDLAYRWTRHMHVVFAMPDTLFWPQRTIADLRDLYMRTGADLALAVFPTDEPECLGPVVHENQRAIAVVDKPVVPPARNTWGAAVWGPRFSELVHRQLPPAGEALTEPALGAFFNAAIHEGLSVRVLAVDENGGFEDAGTRRGIARCLERMNRGFLQ